MRLAALIAGLMLPVPGWAQDTVVLTGSNRIRVETIAGQPRVGFNDRDTLVNSRTTLGVEVRRERWRLVTELWDSRVWGADAGTPVSTNEVNTLEPVQAYLAFDLGAPRGKDAGATVQLGRALLNLGSRRLIAADDYRNTTNGYTGAKVDLRLARDLGVTLLYVLPQVRLPDSPDALRAGRAELDRESLDLVLWGGMTDHAHAIGDASAELTYFHLGERDSPGRATRDRSLDTFGGRLWQEPKAGQFDFEVEGFAQWGETRTGLAAAAPTADVKAGFVHLDIGYSWKGDWRPRLSFEFDWASGDREGGKFGRFDTLFGMRRADLAPAGLYNAIGRTNYLSPGLRLEAARGTRLDLLATYHPMWLAAATDSFSTTNVRDAAGRSGRFAGHQIDMRVRWWALPRRVRVELDALWLAKGRFLRDAPNAPRNGNTRYVSFNVTSSF